MMKQAPCIIKFKHNQVSSNLILGFNTVPYKLSNSYTGVTIVDVGVKQNKNNSLSNSYAGVTIVGVGVRQNKNNSNFLFK